MVIQMCHWSELVPIPVLFGIFSAASHVLIDECPWSMLGHHHDFCKIHQCTPAMTEPFVDTVFVFLGGGFKYFLFSSLLGANSHFD